MFPPPYFLWNGPKDYSIKMYGGKKSTKRVWKIPKTGWRVYKIPKMNGGKLQKSW